MSVRRTGSSPSARGRRGGCPRGGSFSRGAATPRALARFRPRDSLPAFFRQYYHYARGDGKAGGRGREPDPEVPEVRSVRPGLPARGLLPEADGEGVVGGCARTVPGARAMANATMVAMMRVMLASM